MLMWKFILNPKSLSLLGGDSEIRGQIMPLPSNSTTINKATGIIAHEVNTTIGR